MSDNQFAAQTERMKVYHAPDDGVRRSPGYFLRLQQFRRGERKAGIRNMSSISPSTLETSENGRGLACGGDDTVRISWQIGRGGGLRGSVPQPMKVLAYGRAASLLIDWADVTIHNAVEQGSVVLAVRIGDKVARRKVGADKASIEAAIEEEARFLKAGH